MVGFCSTLSQLTIPSRYNRWVDWPTTTTAAHLTGASNIDHLFKTSAAWQRPRRLSAGPPARPTAAWPASSRRAVRPASSRRAAQPARRQRTARLARGRRAARLPHDRRPSTPPRGQRAAPPTPSRRAASNRQHLFRIQHSHQRYQRRLLRVQRHRRLWWRKRKLQLRDLPVARRYRHGPAKQHRHRNNALVTNGS